MIQWQCMVHINIFQCRNINGTENNQPIKIPKDINLTARMEKLLEKNIEKRTAIREIHWLLKEGSIREFSNGNLTIS